MKFLEYVNIHSWLYEFAIHNINLDSLVDILEHYRLDNLRFIKKFEFEITITSNVNNKTYKIKKGENCYEKK